MLEGSGEQDRGIDIYIGTRATKIMLGVVSMARKITGLLCR